VLPAKAAEKANIALGGKIPASAHIYRGERLRGLLAHHVERGIVTLLVQRSSPGTQEAVPGLILRPSSNPYRYPGADLSTLGTDS